MQCSVRDCIAAVQSDSSDYLTLLLQTSENLSAAGSAHISKQVEHFLTHLNQIEQSFQKEPDISTEVPIFSAFRASFDPFVALCLYRNPNRKLSRTTIKSRPSKLKNVVVIGLMPNCIDAASMPSWSTRAAWFDSLSWMTANTREFSMTVSWEGLCSLSLKRWLSGDVQLHPEVSKVYHSKTRLFAWVFKCSTTGSPAAIHNRDGGPVMVIPYSLTLMTLMN